MKRLLYIYLPAILLIAGCSKKTTPSKSTQKKEPPVTVILPPAQVSPVPPVPPVVDSADTEVSTAASPMIVIDGDGKIITSKDKLPASIASKANYRIIARSFTPVQKKNLIYRFKMVPPKVLYVPEEYVSKSAKGKYCVYRKKFWYWQKSDGLFYLDETYYK